MPKIKVISLDHDGTFRVSPAEKGDGYVETDRGAHSLNRRAIFTKRPPILVESLLTAPTPPPYLGEGQATIIVYENSFMPLAHPSMGLDKPSAVKQEALVLRDRRRNSAVVESGAASRQQRQRATAFLVLAAAASLIAILAVASTVLLRYVTS